MESLILLDIQNDFLPGGALAVPGGDEVIAVANSLMPLFDVVAATADWHPRGHASFASSHPGSRIGDRVTVAGEPQVLWPDHGVQGTHGAELSSALEDGGINRIIHKGTEPDIDSYSGFFDNGHRRSTELNNYLLSRTVDAIYIMGLATDYCVKYTALDGVSLGYRTYLVVDGCRGVGARPGDIDAAVKEMVAAGVTVVSAADLRG